MVIIRKWHVRLQKSSSALCVLALLVVFGCTKKADSTKATAHDAHGHAEAGPHQGQLIELGEEEYHGELIHDDANQKVTVYLLDSKAEASVAIEVSEIVLNIMVDDKPTQFKLASVPDSNDPSGKSSRFELTDKTLGDALDAAGSEAHMNVEINGKPYVGIIQHHEHHGHEH